MAKIVLTAVLAAGCLLALWLICATGTGAMAQERSGVAAAGAGQAGATASQPAGEIDWNRARQIHQKEQSGQTLTDEEKAYMENAKAAVRAGRGLGASQGGARPGPAASQPGGDIDWNRARELYQKEQSGQALTDDEKAYLARAKAARQNQAPQSRPGSPSATTKPTGLVPLDQMTADDRYKGEDGGLYGGGRNEPPDAFAKAATVEAVKIAPLDADGKPAADGKIVLMSIGMSNTTQEFSRFKQLADRDEAKSPAVVIVDAAQGGKDAAAWLKTEAGSPWSVADQKLAQAGVTPKQVQAVWLKQALIQPARLGEFPKDAEALKADLVAALQTARARYPNLRVAFLSSRIYAGYASTQLNPEPYAYQGTFAVRWVIQDQMAGKTGLNFDAAKGDVKAPVALWGPYLWGDGLTPRKSDGLVWKPEDVGPDGTHPSDSGRQKVAELLLGFLKTSPFAKGWFVKKP